MVTKLRLASACPGWQAKRDVQPAAAAISPPGVFMSDDSDIVHRRVRNQVMFWLQRIVDIRRDPTPVDLNEVINQWYDWNVEELSDVQLYGEPAYTAKEALAAGEVREAVERFCAATPQTIQDSEAAFGLREWQHLEAAATHALDVMRVRGVSPE
ncbi:hypothetical protein ACFJIX_20065 [Roseateles sp. UC29_93]|uniref:hypothetical protein n=1 Tax=Roseateles sp. UC29_93 TaxID=3350177 RepID=UPI00366F5D0D